MSFANFPLLWLFGARNNILIWATNWSFATFNIFHRHVARVATLQAVAHTVLYIVIYARTGKWWKFLNKAYILWGIVGTVVMVLLLVSSLDRIRIVSYEFFLITHIAFSGNEYWQYLWPSVAVWIFDRLLRLVRLVYCNLHVEMFARTRMVSSTSWMTYDEVADVIRLEISLRRQRFRLKPGDYFFLYQPFRWTGWESHPFTVGAWTQDGNPAPNPSISRASEYSADTSHLPLLADTAPENNNLDASDGESKGGSEYSGSIMTFWIRPYDGWTQKLRQQCLKAKSQPINSTILIEGPYGHQVPVWEYDSMLMIVGGTGIASAVPYLHDHIRRSAGDRNAPQRRTRIQDIELVWTTKQAAFVGDIAHQELKPLLARSDFKASFYSTMRHAHSSRANELDDLGYSIISGRPYLQPLIMSRACDASSAGISLLIFVCGPVSMANEARRATQLAMQHGHRGIKYAEDSFNW
ncbi:FAD-binding 8 [Penicillium chermesinum]|uniref:FAD-binding 8 n=1 Tax=Penicillium chermesinum TaxID=63820 RepID=A0A9W9PJ70_9EURO|nr:FAD-binding 8 [Penicillium chermesinum]KAJ5247803.1 FAD-binding 8 [Penicillium chermesinum]